MGEDEIIHYKLSEKQEKEGIYLPIGAFITAYAREKTIRTSQAIKDYSINKYGQECLFRTIVKNFILSVEKYTQVIYYLII